MDEHFTCTDCQTTEHLHNLHHRFTMPGDYCAACAVLELCAACGELEPFTNMQWPKVLPQLRGVVRVPKEIYCSDCEEVMIIRVVRMVACGRAA